jgi:tetratricopeptide (TPR) repeat protein
MLVNAYGFILLFLITVVMGFFILRKYKLNRLAILLPVLASAIFFGSIFRNNLEIVSSAQAMNSNTSLNWIQYQELANEKKSKGDLSGAISDYSKAIQKGPENTALLYLRGITYAELNDHPKAIEDYKKALILEPNNKTLQFLLKQSVEALKTASLSITQSPNPSADWIQYQKSGNEKKSKGDFLGAISDYSKAIQKGPENTALLYLRGITYAELKDHPKAIEDFKKGLKLEPGNVTFQFLLKQSTQALKARSLFQQAKDWTQHNIIRHMTMVSKN